MLTMNRSKLARKAAADTTRTVAFGRAAGNCVVVTSASRSSLQDIVHYTQMNVGGRQSTRLRLRT
jgi:hypothetical protein